MAELNIINLIIFCLFLSTKAGLCIGEETGWDYLMFTQTWPPVSCLNWQIVNPNNTCSIDHQIDSWTVHGIWPSFLNSPSPSFCNKSDHFDAKQIQSIKWELNKYWPDVHSNDEEYSFWRHEWEKHGTCASTLPALGTQLKYFQQGLTWIKKYNMHNILKLSGIEPSFDAPVLVKDIEAAIRKVVIVKPLLDCEYVETNNTYYIYEIKVCFNKELNLIDCPSPDKGKKRCTPNYLAWYPPIHMKKITPAASGMEAGDVLALMLGLLISTMGFFACLGSYARRQSREQKTEI